MLLLFARPPEAPLAATFASLALFEVIVASTVLFQAPQHARLARGFDEGAYRFLLRTNWIRIAAWSAYALLGLWMLWQVS